ncbi:SubName: Full=Related to guanine nucleotide-binding protein alpha-4 subunit {ECO:0000313/EMBL:CCA73217.1} [Serendipita indica DSM 11827]|nr:SubName: Full=Related to guanine nucleotide-binding protein alpha-4 subunit {ECO:0000313/EMBL:CCA73217.1} [Serendipita indica DSM 11827]
MPPSPKRAASERHSRAKQAAEAKQISDRIDAMLEAERASVAKHKSVVRILLLGQSESGKSTVLKNFQLMYAREAFARDRENWKGVILLNVVRCMQRVVDALFQADAADEDDSADEFSPDAPPPISSLLHDSHRRICLRLRASLDVAERGLKARLSPNFANLPRSRPATAEQHLVDTEAETELAVQAHSWNLGTKEAVNVKQRRLSVLPQEIPIDPSDPNDPTHLIRMCRDDMIDLWNDLAVQEVLARRRVRWQEWPGFFLNDLERVTSSSYHPTDDDVVRARLKTMGVSDYSFVIDRGSRGTYLWRIFDVGGEDSLLLWKSVVSNRLLADVDFILFLNKVDILSAKLRSGVKVQKYVRSYRDRPNTAEAAAKYFKEKFHAILREYSPKKRPFYCYLTSAIDTKATNVILDNVGESILRKNLQTIGVL